MNMREPDARSAYAQNAGRGRASGTPTGARRGGQAANRLRRRGSPLQGAVAWLRGQFARRPLPVWVLVVADVLVFAVALNVFALFHHVLPRREQAVGITSQRGGAAAPVAQTPVSGEDAPPEQQQPEQQDAQASAPEDVQAMDTAAPAASSAASTDATAAQADPEGYFGAKFADKFTDGAVENDGTTYRSANINMTLTDYRHNDVDFHVLDIYVRDVACIKTGFAKDTFGRGMYESVLTVVERMGALAGVNGDFYGGRSDGVVVRNGTLYRDDDSPKRDVCVLYWDGTMETFDPAGFDAEAEMERGAYQIWNFGPMLLDQNGETMEKFNSNVNPNNPRTALGYFEPGHYCLVAVDGRSKASSGLTLKNLSLLMKTLGCTRGYNLDGGDSSVMVYNGALANVPSQEGGGRECSDVIAIAEP